MFNKSLFKREIKANYKIILIFMALLTMYSSMIVAMFDEKLGESLTLMAESMPEMFAAFGMMNPASSLIEFIANYLYGFILIVIPSIFIIILGNKLVARYVDKGSMAYLLATPNTRKKIITTQGIFLITSILLLVCYVVVVCLIVAGITFPGQLDIWKFLIMNIGLLGVLFFLGGMCFLASCIFNDSRYSLGVGGGITVVFILIQMLSQVSDKVDFLKYLTPLTLFQSEKLIAGEGLGLIAILYGASAIMFYIGIKIFTKKDLPL